MRAHSLTLTTAVPTREKVAHLVSWLIDKKARNILALDLTKENNIAEAVVISSATSVRHGQGLAEHLLQEMRKHKYEFLRMEGHSVGQWILLDFNDIIVHIFQNDSRELFRLDDLWPSAGILADTREDR